MTFDPTQNSAPICLMNPDDLAVLLAAKHGHKYLDQFGRWVDCPDNSSFSAATVYRAKPAPAPTLSITVNGVTNVVAAGVTEALADGTDYWVPAPCFNDFVLFSYWSSDQVDHARLKRGLIYTSADAARAHAMAMVGLIAEGVL